jgi:hypothetical protein
MRFSDHDEKYPASRRAARVWIREVRGSAIRDIATWSSAHGAPERAAIEVV